MKPNNIEDIRYPSKNDSNPNIKFEFFNKSIVAFIESLKYQFKRLDTTLPIYMYNNGDELFLYDEINNGKGINSIDSAQVVPRMVLSISSISIDSDQTTNPYVRGEFVMNINGKDTLHSSQIRRVPITLSINVVLTVSTIIEQLEYIELIMLILSREPNFNFQYLSKTNYGNYHIPYDIDMERFFEFSIDSSTRKPTLTFEIPIDLQFPAIDYFGNSFMNRGFINNPIINVDPVPGDIFGPSIPNVGIGGDNSGDGKLPPVKTGDMEEGGRDFTMDISNELIDPSSRLHGGTFQGPTMNSFDIIPKTHADDSDTSAL